MRALAGALVSGTLSLGLLPGPPPALAGEASASGAQFASAREAQAALQRMADELRPLLADLSKLKARYAEPDGLADADSRRPALRGEIERRHLEMDRTALAFNNLRRMEHVQSFQSLLSGARGLDLGAKIAEAFALEEFYKTDYDFRAATAKALEEEEAAHTQAVEAARGRRLIAYGGAALGLLLLSAAGWLARQFYFRRAAPDAALSPPASAPAALPAPAFLSLPSAATTAAAVTTPLVGATTQRPRGASSPAGTATAPPSGAVIGGNFRITRELGRGGMGLVYEALDVTLGRKVAVKKLRGELCRSPKELEMFLAEARLVASLQHPNVVKIHGVVREGDQVYLVFENVDGRPLSRLLEDEGKLRAAEVAAFLGGIAAALDYAHSQRVIHRDLKPSNIMVTGERAVKVMDFGLAHQAKVSVARATRAESWGTPAYMAPEQELGTVSRESDLYSLGACVYEMAVGAPPFTGPNFLAQKREMVYAAPSRAAGLPASFDEAMGTALQPEPANRFHSGAEMLAAVSRALAISG